MNSEEVLENRVSNLESAIATVDKTIAGASKAVSTAEDIIKSKEKTKKIHPFQLRTEDGVTFIDCRSAVFYNGEEINFTPVEEFGSDNKLTKMPADGVIYCWYSFISGEGALCGEGDIPPDGMIDHCPVMFKSGDVVTYYLDSAISATGIDRTYGRIPFQTQKYWIRREDTNLPRYRIFIPTEAVNYNSYGIADNTAITGTDGSQKDTKSDWVHLNPLIDGDDWDLIVYGDIHASLKSGDLIEETTTSGYHTERYYAKLTGETCKFRAKRVETGTRSKERSLSRREYEISQKYDVFGKPLVKNILKPDKDGIRNTKSAEESEEETSDSYVYFTFPVCGVGKERAVTLVTTVTDELGAIYDDVMLDIFHFKQLALKCNSSVVELVGPCGQASLDAFKAGENCNNTEIILYCLGQLLNTYSNVCVFYSGHGGTSNDFPDCEAWVTDFTDTRWCWDFKIAEALSKAEVAKKVWIVSDSCVSGEMYKNVTTFEKGYNSFGEKVIRSVRGGTVDQLLSWGACGKTESAYSDEVNGGGLFTNAMVESFIPGISYCNMWSAMKGLQSRADQHFTKAVVGEFNEDAEIFL